MTFPFSGKYGRQAVNEFHWIRCRPEPVVSAILCKRRSRFHFGCPVEDYRFLAHPVGGPGARLKIRHHFSPVLPRHIVQARPHHVHDAELHLRPRDDRLNRLREFLSSIDVHQIHIANAAIAQYGFNRSSQHLWKELQMGTPKHGRCRRGIRPKPGSIGRPPAGLDGERLLFWQAIAQGHSTERSAEMAGISPAVGTR